MSERTNRRQQIINAASELFMTQGYTATSVRQIADAVGCTEAALYYHFKEGKRTLFNTVVEANLPNFMLPLQRCRDARSLSEIITCLESANREHRSDNQQRMRWLLAEFPTLGAEEQALIREKFQIFHRELAAMIRAVCDQAASAADDLAWLIICLMHGYQQLLSPLDLVSDGEETMFVRLARFVEILA